MGQPVSPAMIGPNMAELLEASVQTLDGARITVSPVEGLDRVLLMVDLFPTSDAEGTVPYAVELDRRTAGLLGDLLLVCETARFPRPVTGPAATGLPCGARTDDGTKVHICVLGGGHAGFHASGDGLSWSTVTGYPCGARDACTLTAGHDGFWHTDAIGQSWATLAGEKCGAAGPKHAEGSHWCTRTIGHTDNHRNAFCEWTDEIRTSSRNGA